MKFLIYSIFATLPFANMSIGGDFYYVEIPLFFAILFLPFHFNKFSFNILDGLVFVYALLNLISVFIGLDALFESARHFRLFVLTPLCLYIVLRFGSKNIEELRRGLFLMLPGIAWQGFLLLNDFIKYGERPVGVEGAASTITLSLLLNIGLFILLFGFSNKLKWLYQFIRCFFVILFFAMLLVCFTRASTIGFFIVVPFIYLFWNKRRIRSMLGIGVMFLVSVMLVLIFSGAMLFDDVKIGVQEKQKIQHNSSRLFNVDLYMMDIRNRVVFWGRMTNRALDNPLFGSGAASATIGKNAGTLFHMGSAHNILISSLITSGLLGLIVHLLIIYYQFCVFMRIDDTVMVNSMLSKVALSSLTVMILVAITNDLTGGRVFIWFVIMGIISKIYDLCSTENNIQKFKTSR